MEVEEYLEYARIAPSTFARKAKIDAGSFLKILRGTSAPRRKTAEKIEKITGGKVSYEEVMAMGKTLRR